MSVQTELQRIIQAKADIIDSIEAKGVTVPSGTTIDNLDDYVDQIQQGGGGDTGEYFYVENTTSGSGNSYTVSFKIADNGNKGSFTVNLEYSTDKENWQTLTINRTSVSSLQPAANQKIYFRHKGPIRTKYVSSSSLYEAYLVIGVNNIGLHYGGELSSLITGNNKKINYIGDSEFKFLFNSGYYIYNMSSMKPHVYLNDDFKLPNATNINSYNGLFQSTKINHLPNDLLPNMELTESCYESMFSNAVLNVSAPALPATTLAKNCYKSMFQYTNITTIPTLPATTLADYCYHQMFYGCTGITTIPANLLPANTLASNCYNNMFYGCTGITTIPANLLPATTLADNCYNHMFYSCTGITTVPTNLLPATTLVSDCYRGMFHGCTALTTAPALPATTLANNCYYQMFYGCSSLTTAPELPATTLANNCYRDMFYTCSSLTTAPELPATTLVSYCYNRMFNGCTNLNYVKCLATDISASACTTGWLNAVASTGTFVKDASMSSWTTGVDGIPSGWTVQDAAA
jgi:hypothetical protein